MNSTRTQIVLVLLLGWTGSALVSAGDPDLNPAPQDPSSFTSGLTISPYGAAAFANGENVAGGGASLQYFFTDKVGISADYAVFAFDDEVHAVSADVALRYPLTQTGIAPYLILGGGVQTDGDTSHGLVRLGGGVDIRLLRSDLGVFVDGVHHWLSNDEDFTIARLGVRLPY